MARPRSLGKNLRANVASKAKSGRRLPMREDQAGLIMDRIGSNIMMRLPLHTMRGNIIAET